MGDEGLNEPLDIPRARSSVHLSAARQRAAWKDGMMETDDLIRVGLLAANELGVPSDAKIVHVARGNAVRHSYKVKDTSPTEAVYQYERTELRWCGDREFGVFLGYSEAAKTLFLRLVIEEEVRADRISRRLRRKRPE